MRPFAGERPCPAPAPPPFGSIGTCVGINGRIPEYSACSVECASGFQLSGKPRVCKRGALSGSPQTCAGDDACLNCVHFVVLASVELSLAPAADQAQPRPCDQPTEITVSVPLLAKSNTSVTVSLLLSGDNNNLKAFIEPATVVLSAHSVSDHNASSDVDVVTIGTARFVLRFPLQACMFESGTFSPKVSVLLSGGMTRLLNYSLPAPRVLSFAALGWKPRVQMFGGDNQVLFSLNEVCVAGVTTFPLDKPGDYDESKWPNNLLKFSRAVPDSQARKAARVFRGRTLFTAAEFNHWWPTWSFNLAHYFHQHLWPAWLLNSMAVQRFGGNFHHFIAHNTSKEWAREFIKLLPVRTKLKAPNEPQPDLSWLPWPVPSEQQSEPWCFEHLVIPRWFICKPPLCCPPVARVGFVMACYSR